MNVKSLLYLSLVILTPNLIKAWLKINQINNLTFYQKSIIILLNLLLDIDHNNQLLILAIKNKVKITNFLCEMIFLTLLRQHLTHVPTLNILVMIVCLYVNQINLFYQIHSTMDYMPVYRNHGLDQNNTNMIKL